MRRITELFIWASIIALLTLFVGGVLYSFLVPENQITIRSAEWQEK